MSFKDTFFGVFLGGIGVASVLYGVKKIDKIIKSTNKYKEKSYFDKIIELKEKENLLKTKYYVANNLYKKTIYDKIRKNYKEEDFKKPSDQLKHLCKTYTNFKAVSRQIGEELANVQAEILMYKQLIEDIGNYYIEIEGASNKFKLVKMPKRDDD